MNSHGADCDLVIRGGLVVDGSGAEGVPGDVAVVGDRIAAVGKVEGRGRREIDASGLVVAPGFIDAHTHMDAQLFWDDLGKPCCWHGVTTVVMGNCGFTLAPARPDERALVVRNLERAEDISGDAMAAGLPWTWSTFSEYLDAVDAAPKGVNHAASIGHSALRTWAMGERAFEETASEDDLAAMAAELRSALRAGAVGFTTSRSVAHATSDDRPVASRRAPWEEVAALVGIVGAESTAVFQLAPERGGDPETLADYQGRLRQLAISSRVPIVFGLFANSMPQPSTQFIDETAALGGEMYGLTHCRGIVSTQSFRTRLGFDKLAEWQDVRSRPYDEQQVLLRDADVRRRLVHAAYHGDYGRSFGPEAARPKFDSMRILESVYPPNPTVAAEAGRRGVDPVEAMIDIALERDLDVFFVQDLVAQADDDLLQLMRHPRTAMVFSDSGAHVSQVFDSSIYTHLLAYWVRERQALTLEEAVQMITSRPARIWRLSDRGRLAPGYAADITVFDPATVAPQMPQVVYDIPGGARRLEQRATGYAATIVNGRIHTDHGEATAEHPGRLLPRFIRWLRRTSLVRIGRVEKAGEVRFCEPSDDGVRLLTGSPETGFAPDPARLAAGQFRLLSPVQAGKILVVLGAFPRGMSADEARKTPPTFAAKLPSSLIAHGDQVIVPPEIGTAVTVEPELAVVIGSRVRRCAPSKAASAVLGFTCFNDITHLPFLREQSDILRAKSADTFGPVGPWIETELREEDVAAGLGIRALINGVEVHSGNTADFIHPVSRVVSEASRYYTLEPGDIISLGTPLHPVLASVGDTVGVEVERVGSLVNQLVSEGAGR